MKKTNKGKLKLGFIYGINLIILLCIINSNISLIIIEKKEVSGLFQASYFIAPKNNLLIHVSPLTPSPEKIILNISFPEFGIQESFRLSYGVDGWGGGYYSNLDLENTYNHYSYHNGFNKPILYEITLEPDDLNGYKVLILHNSLLNGLEIIGFLMVAIISFSIHVTTITIYIDKNKRIKLLQKFLKDIDNKKYRRIYFFITLIFLVISLYAMLGIVFIYS